VAEGINNLQGVCTSLTAQVDKLWCREEHALRYKHNMRLTVSRMSLDCTGVMYRCSSSQVRSPFSKWTAYNEQNWKVAESNTVRC
jgi:hypothetical protein